MLKSLKLFLIRILDFYRHKKSYAQDGEDVVLLSFYEGQKKYKGFFVDVGAHHPVRFSNTWLFYKRGWRGINIDPTPGSMRSFNLLRRRDTNLEVGISTQPQNLTFYCFNEPALNTFNPDLAQERNTGKPYKIINKINVPVDSLRNILDQYLPEGQNIDFLTIDVEGLDLEVLKSNDWEKYRPRFILVEDDSFNVKSLDQSLIYEYLSEKDYNLIAILKRTIIFQIK